MPAPPNRKTQPPDSLLARFLLGFAGVTLPPALAELLARGLAGVVLYRRNFVDVGHLRELTAAIRRAAGREVLIGIDQEGGTRFALNDPFTRWPSAEELGRVGDEHLAKRVAQAMALELRAAGCNLDFAPMLDLHMNPKSPVTTARSFGADPGRMAGMGVAFLQGLRAGGVLPCAKHFPGHGDASVDPHLHLPVFDGTMERLESVELVPFAAAVAAGVPLVMTAHILLPRIDPRRPASLSRRMLDGVLRRSMGFEGLIVADDLGMGAIAKRYRVGDATVEALRAGTDIAMLCHDESAAAPAMAAVGQAREAGLFGEPEWRSSLERIERVCALAESSGPQPPPDIIGCSEHLALSTEISGRARG
jgi:beta-N-acetylhexosaminidase